MWVLFTQEMWWRPRPNVKIRYRPGTPMNVPRACGEKAIADGKATESRNPKARTSPAAE